jgi:hypothetical protein
MAIAQTHTHCLKQRFVEGREVQPLRAVLLAGYLPTGTHQVTFAGIAHLLDLGEQIGSGEHGVNR